MAQIEHDPEGAIVRFKEAWGQAHREGDEGNRVARGLTAAFSLAREEVQDMLDSLDEHVISDEAEREGVANALRNLLEIIEKGR